MLGTKKDPLTVSTEWDVIILGAGAAGLMCAMTAGSRRRRVLVLDHAARAGEKIRVSGGGHCNFTNLHAGSRHYLSENPRFCQTALRAYAPRDFIALVDRYAIRHFDKGDGAIFCTGAADDIVAMLLDECRKHRVTFLQETAIRRVERDQEGFLVRTSRGDWHGAALVVALGGRSMPKLGATGLGCEIARQFGLRVIPERPGLAPLLLGPESGPGWGALAGISLRARAMCGTTGFTDAMLFTHRGLSGPAILRLSSHWRPGTELLIDLAPEIDLFAHLPSVRQTHPRQAASSALGRFLPGRLACHLAARAGVDGHLAEIGNQRLRALTDTVHRLRLLPAGTGGYGRAEVTVGGVDTLQLDPGTMACRTIAGLYFIGEVVDVTGCLGGFNLQWAWSSGYVAGQAV